MDLLKGVLVIDSPLYIAFSIVVLAVVAILVFVVNVNSRMKRLTPLAGIAFAFVVAGIVFGDDRLLGYVLMGVGVLIAIVDMFKRSKSE
jgi:hypothetical protein